MSINHFNNSMTVECDDCGELFESGYGEFRYFIEELKMLGWTMGNVKGEWWHKCPDCSDPAEDFSE